MTNVQVRVFFGQANLSDISIILTDVELDDIEDYYTGLMNSDAKTFRILTKDKNNRYLINKANVLAISVSEYDTPMPPRFAVDIKPKT